MGRGYIVEESVETYLANLSSAAGPCLTGLLIGQSSAQRDFVVLAVQTPCKESEGSAQRGSSSLDSIDVDWISEHAREVSRMLPGGVNILGLFLITPPELSKEAQNTLKKLIFAVDKYTSKSRLWDLTEDDVTDRAALHICSKTRRAVCKTFDVKDPKSSAKPAEWKYQASVSSSWPVLTCSVEVGLQIPVTTSSSKSWEECVKDGLRQWAKQIEAGVCLINGRPASDDTELLSGSKKNTKSSQQQTLRAQILISAEDPDAGQRTSAQVRVCSGSVCVRGAVSCRAYIHSSKPKTRQAVQAVKRDIINTVSNRVETLLEDLQMNEADAASGQQLLPRRVFAPLRGSGLSVCDYMFPDETAADVAERLKELLDVEWQEGDVDVNAEAQSCCSASGLEVDVGVDGADADGQDESKDGSAETGKKPTPPQYYAVAAAVGLLATAVSLLYVTHSL